MFQMPRPSAVWTSRPACVRSSLRGTAVQPLAVDYRHEFIVVQLATGTITYESHEVARTAVKRGFGENS